MYPEFLRAFWAHTLAFQRALLNFQGLRVRGPFLLETLIKIQDSLILPTQLCYRPTASHFNLCNSFTRRSLFHDTRRDLTFQVPMFTVVLALLNFRTSLTFQSAGTSTTCFPIAGFRHAASSTDDLVCLGLVSFRFWLLFTLSWRVSRKCGELVWPGDLPSDMPFSYLVSSFFCS